jgi:hypothetical protein
MVVVVVLVVVVVMLLVLFGCSKIQYHGAAPVFFYGRFLFGWKFGTPTETEETLAVAKIMTQLCTSKACVGKVSSENCVYML